MTKNILIGAISAGVAVAGAVSYIIYKMKGKGEKSLESPRSNHMTDVFSKAKQYATTTP